MLNSEFALQQRETAREKIGPCGVLVEDVLLGIGFLFTQEPHFIPEEYKTTNPLYFSPPEARNGVRRKNVNVEPDLVHSKTLQMEAERIIEATRGVIYSTNQAISRNEKTIFVNGTTPGADVPFWTERFVAYALKKDHGSFNQNLVAREKLSPEDYLIFKMGLIYAMSLTSEEKESVPARIRSLAKTSEIAPPMHLHYEGNVEFFKTYKPQSRNSSNP